jgi:hypothetical protein
MTTPYKRNAFGSFAVYLCRLVLWLEDLDSNLSLPDLLVYFSIKIPLLDTTGNAKFQNEGKAITVQIGLRREGLRRGETTRA